MDVKPGDKIAVVIEGVEYETYIDDRGTQRFPEVEGLRAPLWSDVGRFRGQDGPRYAKPVNDEVKELAKTNTAVAWLVANNPTDLNEMAMAYHEGKFTQRHYAEFNMMIGYSVGGWAELSSFFDMEIDNPLYDTPIEELARVDEESNDGK